MGSFRRTEDALIIGVDMAKNGDVASLCVARCNEDKRTIINMFFGREAESLYAKLTIPNSKLVPLGSKLVTGAVAVEEGIKL